jgi:uncharacterized membrane protein
VLEEFAAVAVVALTVAFVGWLERQDLPAVQRLLQWFPAILFAYVIPALFTHSFGLDLSRVSLHTLSRDGLIPLAIVAVMSALPLAKLRVVGLRPLVLFVGGSCFIATLPVLLVFFLGSLDPAQKALFIDQSYWKGLVPIVGGWIGGSTSQLVLKEVIDTEEGLFLSILVLDNVLVNLWTILMFQFIRRTRQFNEVFGIDDAIAPITIGAGAGRTLSPAVTALLLVLIVIAAYGLGLPFLWKVIGLSIVGLLLVNLLPAWNVTFVLRVGGLVIVLIMAILGLRLNFSNFSLPTTLVLLVVAWLLLHYALMLGLALALRLNLVWLPIASMANLGGISTAPAVTSAYRRDLMPHAILLAILSMVSGTAWGLLTIWLFRRVFGI